MSNDEFEDLASKLSLKDFDLLILADGSATTSQKPGGWASLVYDRHYGQYTPHFGGSNYLTNNVAELLPFIYSLWKFDYEHNKRPAQETDFCYATPKIKVECISDSEIVVKGGNRVYKRDANACFWSAIELFEQKGYDIHWNWLARNSHPLHKLMDNKSREFRVLMEGHVNA